MADVAALQEAGGRGQGERVRRLYGGERLPGIDMPWAEEARIRLRNLAVRYLAVPKSHADEMSAPPS
ncbi:MAG: hypothetical protein IPK20_17520 [Betaproteobacteria bacterium]|nr:hypothetical protein [Betaproteobacteria bacterium]